MANTTPDNIYFPTRDDMVAPLETVFATLASSVQSALNTRAIRAYRWDTNTQKDAQTGMRKGDEGKVIADLSEWTYDGTRWVKTVARGTTTFTTDGNGLAMVSHGMGSTPGSVQFTQCHEADTNNRTALAKPVLGTLTANEFQVVTYRLDTFARLGGTPVKISWVAFR